MKKLHEKSPCCRAVIYKFGGKRRQCSTCKKTWTLWAKKRGVKPSRPNRKLLEKVLIEKRSLLSPRMTKKHLSKSALSARLSKAMRSCLERPTEALSTDDSVILVIDALWFQFKNIRWTLYLGAIRDIDSNQAEILEPKLVYGRECYLGWKSFIDGLPDNIKTRIKAVVADGFRGIDRIARLQNWILQRCHFHLIAQLQVNRGRWKKMPDTPLREEIYQAVVKLLVAKENKQILERHLQSLIKKYNCPRRLKMIASEFLRHLHQFRSYMIYPELKLPATANSIESLNKIIRSRCKHISTPESLMLRIKTLIKMKRTITCNPKIFNKY
jgi:hypothetical protein